MKRRSNVIGVFELDENGGCATFVSDKVSLIDKVKSLFKRDDNKFALEWDD